MRAFLVALGFGLAVLWLVGIFREAPRWLEWLDLVAGIIAIGAAVLSGGPALRVLPFLLATGLFALWIGALATGAQSYLTWWNFAFGVGFLLVGAGLLVQTRGAPDESQVRPGG